MARPVAPVGQARVTLALGTVRPQGPEGRGSARKEGWGLGLSDGDTRIRSRALAGPRGPRGPRGSRGGSSELCLLGPSGAAAQVGRLGSL